MRKFKVGDIVMVEAQLASADEDIQEAVFGEVGIVVAVNDGYYYPIAVEHEHSEVYVSENVYGNHYFPEELCLLDSVE